MSYAGQGPYILCEDLFKIYKRAELEVVALRGLDLVVDPGELIAIIGASGSGVRGPAVDRPIASSCFESSAAWRAAADASLIPSRTFPLASSAARSRFASTTVSRLNP